MNESGIHIKTFTNEESFNKELTQFDTILEECKNITIKKLQEKVQRWRNLKKFLPIYSLFKVDKTLDDKDNDIQDPMKLAVKEKQNLRKLIPLSIQILPFRMMK
jgi:protein-tyrosine-phosphatase